MKELQEHHAQVNGMNVHMVQTDKYKTNTIVLMIKAPLQSETVSQRAILPHILQGGSEKFPTRQQIRSQLDELYGASMYADVQKKGEDHVIVFRLDVANENFINDPTPLFEKGMELLADVLLHPKLDGQGFAQTVVESEKRSLKQRIQAIYDDKMRYANMRITEEMCKNEPFGLLVYGKEDGVDTLTSESLYSYYQNMLIEDEIDLYVIGDLNQEKIKQTISSQFNFTIERAPKKKVHEITNQPIPSEEKVVFDEQDVKQGKLHIGYRTYTTYSDKEYYALQVMNGLYGGFSHSKLFLNVREKESLAYYAASRYESHKGILMVMSGIEFTNYDKAVRIIKEQMEAMRNGEFTEDEINQTKAMIKNQLLETVDVAKAYIELLYHNVVSGKERTVEEWLQGIDAVTKEEMVAVANKLKLDTIYFLKGKEVV
ncbi:EF-P 5-aminopentanol modification-associated protein YfmF [Bacillus sp. FJAT-45350]|uniref:EF-P 5-aminopentanol modification-associated protein YfmF n=1 Tax=Bacillus sp. FJAT-45350 TaxID=2011014 RepID=UPI000BB8F610|nr:pitrilysin family protein [Bacillus sp. FJAT-45350]